MSFDLISETAESVVDLLKKGKVSPIELLVELEAQHRKVDREVNALPITCFGNASRAAQSILQFSPEDRGVLCGLPVTIKDLTNVSGVRTTFGSPIFSDNVPKKNGYVVDNIECAGGIVYAKSNTPEFGAGASTFNPVFGITRNPHDLSKSAAGSSGGAAASLASGTSWLSHGSDNGGSLRNPASFCGVVGLRPSPGRVPRGPSNNPFQHLSVDGPMARNVSDVALFLDAMANEVAEDALSIGATHPSYLASAKSGTRPRKVAFSPDLGLTPVDPEIAAICEKAALNLEKMGASVELAAPDFSGLKRHYRTLRSFNYAVSNGHLLEEHGTLLKPDVANEIRKGRSLDAESIIESTRAISKYRSVASEFFQNYDLLVTPTTIVPAFDAELTHVSSFNGVQFEDYLDWLEIAFVHSFVSLPALSMPVGSTKSGLPVGIQLVTGHRQEALLLSFAKLLEEQLALDLTPVRFAS